MLRYHLVMLGLFVSLLPTVAEAKLVRARKLTGHVIRSLVKVSPKVCKNECERRRNCLSYNYNRYFTLCELNGASEDSNPGITLEASKQWIYQNVEKSKPSDVSDCGGTSCVENAVCRETSRGHQCRIEECGPYNNTSAHVTVRGNMNDIGSLLKLSCNTGYPLFGNTTVVCNLDGQWVEGNHYCETVCPIFNTSAIAEYIQIRSAVIVTDKGIVKYPSASTQYLVIGWPDELKMLQSVGVGSAVLYLCQGIYTQVRSLFCSDGHWSYTPGCYDSVFAIQCHVDIQNVEHLCLCPIGTAYSYSQQQCVTRCSGEFADDFEDHPNYELLGREITMQYDYNIFSRCQDLCTSTTDCNIFEYRDGGGYLTITCILTGSVSFSDHPSIVRNSSEYHVYIRNCN